MLLINIGMVQGSFGGLVTNRVLFLQSSYPPMPLLTITTKRIALPRSDRSHYRPIPLPRGHGKCEPDASPHILDFKDGWSKPALRRRSCVVTGSIECFDPANPLTPFFRSVQKSPNRFRPA